MKKVINDIELNNYKIRDFIILNNQLFKKKYQYQNYLNNVNCNILDY